MNINDIAQLGWVKRWSATFNLLGCSYWGEQYICSTKKALGKGFHQILFIHAEGVTTCYRLKSETIALGKFLSRQVEKSPTKRLEIYFKLTPPF